MATPWICLRESPSFPAVDHQFTLPLTLALGIFFAHHSAWQIGGGE